MSQAWSKKCGLRHLCNISSILGSKSHVFCTEATRETRTTTYGQQHDCVIEVWRLSPLVTLWWFDTPGTIFWWSLLIRNTPDFSLAIVETPCQFSLEKIRNTFLAAGFILESFCIKITEIVTPVQYKIFNFGQKWLSLKAVSTFICSVAKRYRAGHHGVRGGSWLKLGQ